MRNLDEFIKSREILTISVALSNEIEQLKAKVAKYPNEEFYAERLERNQLAFKAICDYMDELNREVNAIINREHDMPEDYYSPEKC